EKFRSLVEQSLVGVFILQNDSFLYVNPGLEKISGYTKSELEGGIRFTDLVHPDDITIVERNYQRRISGHKTDNQYSFRALAKSGEVRYMEAILSQIVFDRAPAVIGTIIDITDRVEEEKRIGKAVTDAQERERTEIGMELHDNVQQIMVGTLMNIEFAKGKIDDKTVVEKTFSDVSIYIGNALHELRRLSHQLAPSMSMPGSFTDKVRDLVNTMNKANKIEFSVEGEYENDWLGEDLQIALYRIVQEQLSNIFKYAQASNVWIVIQQDTDILRLIIRDNGIGFDLNAVKRGIGLENINRRAYVLGGHIKIITAPEEGCELQVELPLK
ncbi:MAG: PAS domain S-box protein, partial [Fervidobacterium pennivorans]